MYIATLSLLAVKKFQFKKHSCGDDSCESDAGSLPLDWSEYREHGTEFIKASTDPKSIASQLEKVYKMSKAEKADMGKKARQWVIDNFSIKKIGGELESFIDSCDFLNKDRVYNKVKPNKNPDAQVDMSLPNDKFIISLYKLILDFDVNESDQGYQYWMKELQKNVDRQSVVRFFRDTAI